MSRAVTIAVTCVGGRLIYDIVLALRSASDLNVRIVGIDADPEAHGRVLCDVFAVLPIAEEAPDDYLAGLRDLHRQHKLDFVLVLSEGESQLLSRHRDELVTDGMALSVSSQDTVALLTDKLRLLETAQTNGIDNGLFIPIDSTEQAGAALQQLGYPEQRVVIKPRDGRGSRGVLIFDATIRRWTPLLENRFCGTGDVDSLFAEMDRRRIAWNGLIAVPHTAGPVYDVDCIAVSGRLTDVAARLRQLRNPLYPTSTGHKIDMHSDVLEHARRLCEAFAVDGAADFDIAIRENGQPMLFDAGARFSGSVGGSFTAGANFPAQLVRTKLGMPYRPLKISDGTVLRPFITMAQIPSGNELDYL